MSTDSIEQPSLSNFTLSVIGALASLLLFLFIIIIFKVYLPDRQPAVDAKIVQQRVDVLATNQAEQQRLVTACEWIDREKGIVRIPVEHAKTIIIDRLNAQ